jgi:hypothetical protein
MKCPHCLHDVSHQPQTAQIIVDDEGSHAVTSWNCPNEECKKAVIQYRLGDAHTAAIGL